MLQFSSDHHSLINWRSLIFSINKTVWLDCKAATKFEKIDWGKALTQWLTYDTVWPWKNGQSQGHKSGNKILEDPLWTNLNAKVYLHVIYCKNIKWPWTGKVKVSVTQKGCSWRNLIKVYKHAKYNVCNHLYEWE